MDAYTSYIKAFPSDYESVLARINSIDAIQYAKSRNYLDGSVTYLSPYFTHGVISTRDVFDSIMQRYSLKQAEKLIFELGWRDFYQMAHRWHGEGMFNDIRQAQEPIRSQQIPQAVVDANTGISVIDAAIKGLYETGYMHNHARMWLASLICNVAQVHWSEPAKWLYYHLLDGDLASNTLSWQWVAGSFSSKKYYANQENLNKYSSSYQQATVLDTSYAALPELEVPEHYKTTASLTLSTPLPASTINSVTTDKPILLYHIWMLNPTWQVDVDATRVLILEPSFFKRFPMSQKRLNFVLSLAKEIQGLEIFVGELDELIGLDKALDVENSMKSSVKSIEHPALKHWKQFQNLQLEKQSSIFQPAFKEYRSFFAYWKACQKTEEFKQSYGKS